MRRLAIALSLLVLLLIAPPAMADDFVYRQGTLIVRITSQPCTSEQLATTLKVMSAASAPMAADVEFQRRRTVACWALDSDGDVLMADTDGDTGFLPRVGFKREPGV